MPRWHDPGLSLDERRMLEALDLPGNDWTTEQKREWEAMAADPDWYERRKAEWGWGVRKKRGKGGGREAGSDQHLAWEDRDPVPG